jgi:3-hydroxybutyryl-CoA dehydratase
VHDSGNGVSDVSGAWFDEVNVGDRFGARVTVTDAHLVLGAGFIGDFNPHHVDDEYAKASRFGTRIRHGVLTSALMGGPVGMHFHGTAMAYLEHAARFMAPVRPGDMLSTQWIVTECHPKPHKQCGVVVMAGVCRNQHGEIVAEADGKMLVHERPTARTRA